MALIQQRLAWAVAVVAGACQLTPGSAASERVVQLGQEFVLAPAESVRLANVAGARVHFQRVVSDRRCPRQVTCAISGPVTVEVELQGAGESKRTAQLSVLDRDVGGPKFEGITSCVKLGKLALKLRDVQPWPTENGPVAREVYRASLVVAESCDSPRP